MELVEYLEKVVDLGYLALYSSSSLSLMVDVWKRQPSQEEIRAGLTIMTGQMIECNCRLKLADFRKVVAFDEESQLFFAEQLIPALRFTKMEKLARVVSNNPDSLKAGLRMAQITDTHPLLKGKVQHRVFLDMDEAIAWLGI